MIEEILIKDKYVPKKLISNNRYKLMFKVENIVSIVYEKDDEGNIIYDEDGNPIIIDIEDTDYCRVLTTYFKGECTEAAMRKLVADWYDPEIKNKIINGFVWTSFDQEVIPVYLSVENQINFKSAYDLAVQKQGATLPVRLKMGENNGVPIYHTFSTMEEADDFYTKAVNHVESTRAEGWAKKDNFDWSLYTTPINNE